MNLTSDQINKTFQVWNYYIENGNDFLNKSGEYTDQELDRKRYDLIPKIKDLIIKFLSGELEIGAFKTQLDSINKKNRLWGFMAINGQMFFNMVVKTSQKANKSSELIRLLKKIIIVPPSMAVAKKSIEEFEVFVRDLGQYSTDLRGAPKIGSIPYFLSYFWQIQNPEIYPVYYTSMVQAFQNLEIWTPNKTIAENYGDFYELNHLIIEKINQKYSLNIKLWNLEHAFWLHFQTLNQQNPKPEITDTPIDGHVQTQQVLGQNLTLPESYIPPVISILPQLSINDPDMVQICQQKGKAIEKVFEERLSILFEILGYESSLLGQGHGRVPDGVVISEEYHYAIIFDAKVRQNGYSMGTDDRAIREYITNQSEPLRRRGIRNIYFLIISNKFNGNNEAAIRRIKIETHVNEVILAEVEALLAMVDRKLRDSMITLGPEGLQGLLAFSGVLTKNSVIDFIGS